MHINDILFLCFPSAPQPLSHLPPRSPSSKCKRRVSRDTLTCENADCPQGSLAGQSGDLLGAAQQDTFTQYHVTLDLTDSTATLPACLLTPDAAEKMLQCSVGLF